MGLITDWNTAYSRIRSAIAEKRDLILEIGVGNGEFLSWVAATSPFFCIGSDIKKKRVARSIKKLEQVTEEGVVLLGDGKRVLRDLFPCGSLTKIVLNYPDPWRKKHQSWRRISYPFFVKLMTGKLKAGGVIHISTDAVELFEEFSYAVLDEKIFKPIPSKPQKNLFRGMVTRYETQWISEGRDLYQWSFLKRFETPCEDEWEKIAPEHFRITSLPESGSVEFIDGWVIKLLYKKENQFRLLLVEKESRISYNISFLF